MKTFFGIMGIITVILVLLSYMWPNWFWEINWKLVDEILIDVLEAL